MKFTINREQLLKPLQYVVGALSNRPALPILGNILLQSSDNNTLLMTSTDLEIEMIAKISLTEPCEPGIITIPGKKLFDICRGLPEESQLSITLENNRVLIQSNRSRFSLSTLPVNEFPNLEEWQSEVEFHLPQGAIKRLIERTQFSMAHQDVRYYLNGMLLETTGNQLRSVATDGHRLAVSALSLETELPSHSVIVPRKGIIELVRLLSDNDSQILVQIGYNNLRIHVDDLIFTSKLVDGRFPDYRRVLPENPNKILTADCETLKQAFSRVAILSNEKFRGVRLYLTTNQLTISANNPEQEEAEEIIDIDYTASELEIGFNVSYILDILNTLKCKQVKMLFTDPVSSVQIEDMESDETIYVVMPMRL